MDVCKYEIYFKCWPGYRNNNMHDNDNNDNDNNDNDNDNAW